MSKPTLAAQIAEIRQRDQEWRRWGEPANKPARDRSKVIEAYDALSNSHEKLVAALERGLEEGALGCKFYPVADDDAVCCCGKARAYHWKFDARALLASLKEQP